MIELRGDLFIGSALISEFDDSVRELELFQLFLGIVALVSELAGRDPEREVEV